METLVFGKFLEILGCAKFVQICIILMLRMLLKIRGRVFPGKRLGFEDYDQNSRTNLLQSE